MTVNFYPENHSYIDSLGRRYLSVTQIIHLCCPKFDEIYWGNIIKDQRNRHNFQDKVWSLEDVLEEWKMINKIACERGSQIHDNCERFVLDGAKLPVQWDATDELISYFDYLEKQDYYTRYKTVECEKTLFDSTALVAGRADLIVGHEEYFDVEDYKTNKELKFEGYQRETLKKPFNHLQNCNMVVYALQLSMYAVLEHRRTGRKCRRLRILHLLDSKVTEYVLKPLYREAELLLKLAPSVRKHYNPEWDLLSFEKL